MKPHPACPSEGRVGREWWGRGGGGAILYARGAGTGGKTCTLTSWRDPSPLGPGDDPDPGMGWQTGLMQQRVDKRWHGNAAPLALSKGQRAKGGHAVAMEGPNVKYLQCTYTRVRRAPLLQAMPEDQRVGSTDGVVMPGAWV